MDNKDTILHAILPVIEWDRSLNIKPIVSSLESFNKDEY